MQILQAASSRYATKAFDPSGELSQQQIDAVKELIRLSPSSVNSQPWHVFLAATEEGRARVAKATEGDYVFNKAKVMDASLVLVYCARTGLDADYLERLADQEKADGRYASDEVRETIMKARNYFVGLNNGLEAGQNAWLDKQVYLNLGQLLLGVSALGIDAVPIEGFDREIFDSEFDLAEQGLTSLVVVALGQRSEQDFNAGLPKSRWPAEQIFTEI